MKPVLLFGATDRRRWHARRGEDFGWRTVDDALEVVPGAGDLLTEDRFTDHQLHLEFWLPSMPWAQGQDRANSGVYLQGRYELQILDSYQREPPRDDDCGAIYKVAAPLVNACGPPEQWQMLDVAFRAPTAKTPALITVFLNGLLIHHAMEVSAPTGGGLDDDVAAPGPLMLQDHGCPVRYRNIWVLPL